MGGCISSRSNPLDPPLRVAVVRSVALIIVVGRLIMVVCQQGGKMRTGSASLVRSLPLRRSAGPQVRSPHFTPGRRVRVVCWCILRNLYYYVQSDCIGMFCFRKLHGDHTCPSLCHERMYALLCKLFLMIFSAPVRCVYICYQGNICLHFSRNSKSDNKISNMQTENHSTIIMSVLTRQHYQRSKLGIHYTKMNECKQLSVTSQPLSH